MGHLQVVELVDLLDGRLAPARAKHLDACAECAARAEKVREEFQTAADIPMPETSPLFWPHLASRVRDAIQEEPAPRAAGAGRFLHAPAWAWAATAVVAIVASATVWRLSQPGVQFTTLAVPDRLASGEPPGDTNHDVWNEDIEVDEAWAVVRAVAEDVGWDGATEAGIGVRPQSAEHVVPQLSTEERSELARLIEEELRRSGA